MSATTVYNKGNLIKWAIALGIPLILLIMPMGEAITMQMRLFFVLTAMCMLVVCFELLDILMSSVLLLSLYCICGVAPSTTCFGAFTYPIVYLFLGTFVLTIGLDETGLLNRIAFWCIRRCGGTFNGTVIGLVITGYILGAITFCNAWLIMVTLCYGVCRAMNIDHCKEAAIMMMAGWFASTGPGLFVYNPSAIVLMKSGASLIVPEWDLMWFEYMFYNLMMPIFTISFLVILMIVHKTKHSKVSGGREYFDGEYKKLGKMSAAEKKAGIILAILAVFLLTNPLHHIDVNYGFMLLPWLYFLPGLKIANPASLKKINFGMWFFIVACMSIGTVGTAVGVGTLVGEAVTPILSGMNALACYFVILLSGIAANFLMTPSAMLAIFSAPVTQIAVDLGINPTAYLMTIQYATDLILLPYEVPVYMFLFSFGVISFKDFVKYNGLKMIYFFIFFLVIILPYWSLIGLK